MKNIGWGKGGWKNPPRYLIRLQAPYDFAADPLLLLLSFVI